MLNNLLSVPRFGLSRDGQGQFRLCSEQKGLCGPAACNFLYPLQLGSSVQLPGRHPNPQCALVAGQAVYLAPKQYPHEGNLGENPAEGFAIRSDRARNSVI